jgi:hypothetical protein
MSGRAINIRKKIVYLIVFTLFFTSFSGAATFKINYINSNISKLANQNYSHTVFAGVAATQSCGPCHNWTKNIHNTYMSGDFDFEYATMIAFDEEGDVLNYDAFNWAENYSVSTFPTTIIDGNYQRINGDHLEQLPDALNTSGNRTITDITANITVLLAGKAKIKITIAIENNEEFQYNGYIRTFITEIVSRYNTSLGDPFHFGFLDFAFDKSISINSGEIYTENIIWNGKEHEDTHGDDFGDIKANNIQVLLTIYNNSNGYVDETIIAQIPNNPPNKPNEPFPQNGAVDVKANVDLNWNCTDPDGDELTYDVYLGNTTPPQLVVSNLSDTFYDPGFLDFETTYFWKIVADDNRGGLNESPLWSFTTKPNYPPETPGEPFGPVKGNAGEKLEYVTSTYDPDGDDLFYLFDWGNGNNSGWVGPFKSNEIANASYIWSEGGDYKIKVKARDIYGVESNWSQNLSIQIVAPIIEIGDISGGLFRVNAVIKNVGDGEATNVNWDINLTSGLILIGRQTSCKLESILPEEESIIISKIFFGIGKIEIVINAQVKYGKSDTKSIEAFLLGCYIQFL